MTARLWFTVTLILFSFNAAALDNEIKVLVVKHEDTLDYSGTDKPVSDLTQSIDRLKVVWAASIASGPVTLTVVNQKVGLNYDIPKIQGPSLTGPSPTQTWIHLNSSAFNIQTLRNNVEADLVVVLVPGESMMGANPNSKICGFAPQQHWTDWKRYYLPSPGEYVEGPYDLDRSGVDDSYIAIISDLATCMNSYPDSGELGTNLIAHEVGHLFGAGHDLAASTTGHLPPSSVGYYLNPEAHATVIAFSLPYFNIHIYVKTVLARNNFVIAGCAAWPTGCTRYLTYSTSGAMDNVATIDQTKLSVANYRPLPPPPPSCGLSTPTNVRGRVLQRCNTNYDMTQHQIDWSDSCPDQTYIYQVWASPSGPFGPWTDVIGVYQPTTAPLWNMWNSIPAWVKVRACSTTACTALSSSYYYAPVYCWNDRPSPGGGGRGGTGERPRELPH